MAAWLAWSLAVVGLAYLVTESVILAPLRVALARLHPLAASLIYCPACSGFWIGLGLYGLYPSEALPAGLLDHAGPWLRVLLSGLSAVALCSTWSKATGGNGAWAAEAALRGEGEVAGDETTPSA
jgi:hypothetical protein